MTDVIDVKLAEIFSVVLENNSSDVVNIRRISEIKWDSLAQVSIIVGIETEFDISLNSADYEMLTSYAAARVLVESKVNGG